jgi:hypothetical protein
MDPEDDPGKRSSVFGNVGASPRAVTVAYEGQGLPFAPMSPLMRPTTSSGPADAAGQVIANYAARRTLDIVLAPDEVADSGTPSST